MSLSAKRAKRTQFPRRSGAWGRKVLYKQTQFLPLCRSGDRRSREGKLCETKPNLGGLGYLGDGVSEACCAKQNQPLDCGPRSQPRVTALRIGPGPAAGHPIAQNEPNFGRCGRPDHPLFQYSIIPPFQSGANRAKRTQFALDRANCQENNTVIVDYGRSAI